MKLKQQPDDFQVEEVTDVIPAEAGPFAFYRLEKTGWSTPDALAVIRRRWGIEPRRLGYGGLKDRHARTIQYFTIFHGPKRELHHQSITVHYLGQVAEAFGSQAIRCNRFHLTLRDLNERSVAQAESRLESVRSNGVPNYFDDQRFGSVAGPDQGFVGRELVRGRFEEALRLALLAPYEFDRALQKREKQLLATHWGDWAKCVDVLPRGHARSLSDYLRVHPADFRGAVIRLRPELRGLYLSVYQSYLWNRMLARWLREHCRKSDLREVDLRLGPAPFPAELDPQQREAWKTLQIPLPSARLKLDESDPLFALVNAVLAEERLSLAELRVRGVRDLFFSKGVRSAACIPSGLTAEFGGDELRAGRQKLILSFELPRGCYATMVVKALTTPALDESVRPN
jgi:tRNA pseudouridine13 synthase